MDLTSRCSKRTAWPHVMVLRLKKANANFISLAYWTISHVNRISSYWTVSLLSKAGSESLEVQDHLIKISKIWGLKNFFLYKLEPYLHIKFFKNFGGPKRMFHWTWAQGRHWRPAKQPNLKSTNVPSDRRHGEKLSPRVWSWIHFSIRDHDFANPRLS